MRDFSQMVRESLYDLTETSAGNANGTGKNTFASKHVEVYVNATSVVSGTLDVTVQVSPDGGDTWFDLHAFDAITAAGGAVKAFNRGVDAIGTQMRIQYAVTGTVTFEVFMLHQE